MLDINIEIVNDPNTKKPKEIFVVELTRNFAELRKRWAIGSWEARNEEVKVRVSGWMFYEPGERRHSLALDTSEVFKPVIADQVIFNLVKNRLSSRSASARNSTLPI